MPPGTIWNEFPALAVTILFLVILGGGARLVWEEWRKERDKDRAWREVQNAAREAAVEKQNNAWQRTVTDLAARWEQQDQEREITLKALADATRAILNKLERHDERVVRIEQNMQSRRRSS